MHVHHDVMMSSMNGGHCEKWEVDESSISSKLLNKILISIFDDIVRNT